ncbi:hypothetical protein [Neorhodopirellula pilleata]|uniref:Sulfatase n=1 Tax=Neorhodopirellula pilleata TaxID=2714738 RepID=A0A5C5ZL44_9BACT|nr:hypothetical protein [Neorhodopirellula pilleata]TWT87910.1 hypothetical protein Pla100_58590 [Neorhodopirellula pilleata]
MLLLTFEGLSPASLSCYGASWNRTESIDAIAADGVAFDRVIVNHTDPLRQVSAWLRKPGFIADRCTLVTDDERFADIDGIDRVGELVLLPVRAGGVADSIEGTSLAALAAVAAEQIAMDEHVWLHSRFLTRCWDAPRNLFPIEHLDNEDDGPLDESETIEEEIAHAERPTVETARVPSILDVWQPPAVTLSQKDDPDWIMAWMRTYGCQVRLIDEIVGLLTDMAAEHHRGGIAVAGTSGFALGQNQAIGHQQGPLRSCHLHVPFLIQRFDLATSDCTGIRNRQVIGLDRLGSIIDDEHHFDAINGPTQWASPAKEDSILTYHDDRPVAINTDQWFYVDEDHDGKIGKLFLKPDDASDVNDVARLRSETSEELAARLA